MVGIAGRWQLGLAPRGNRHAGAWRQGGALNAWGVCSMISAGRSNAHCRPGCYTAAMLLTTGCLPCFALTCSFAASGPLQGALASWPHEQRGSSAAAAAAAARSVVAYIHWHRAELEPG